MLALLIKHLESVRCSVAAHTRFQEPEPLISHSKMLGPTGSQQIIGHSTSTPNCNNVFSLQGRKPAKHLENHAWQPQYGTRTIGAKPKRAAS